jgi:hypothetical protein
MKRKRKREKKRKRKKLKRKLLQQRSQFRIKRMLTVKMKDLRHLLLRI